MNELITLVVAMLKGGQAKSITAFNMAKELARNYDLRVLLVDFDPQNSQGDLVSIVNPKATIYDVLSLHQDIHTAIHQVGDIWIIPSQLDLVLLEAEWVQKLARRVKNHILGPIANEFDIVIFDSPSSAGSLLQALLRTVQFLLITCTPDHMSWVGLKAMELLKWKANQDRHRSSKLVNLGITITRYKGGRLYNPKEIMEKLRNDFGKNPGILPQFISESVAVTEAAYHGQSMHEWNRKHKVTKQYEELTKLVYQKIKEVRNGKKRN